VLTQRILSALVLAPIALAAVWIGSWVFALLVGAGAAVAAWEWTRLCGWSLVWTSAGIVYIALPVAALIWLREQDQGRVTTFWLLLAVWSTDSAAYAAGRLIGGWRLMPSVSPNKTWAGLVGGIAGAALVGAALGLALGFDASLLALAGAALALVAQGGDLMESAIKRRFGAKDSGRLIPGHGGLLDRIDGLMTAAPAAAAMCLAAGGGIARWP
jgi:phosphatidate cytidylyltransferase